MRLVWPILRKDLRHLWTYLVVLWALLFAAVWWKGEPGFDAQSIALQVLPVAATFACWVFLTALIHDERLVGDRQYWLTRPLGWRRVLAAKVLAALALVCVPVFVFQAIVFAAHGLSPMRFFGDLLSKTVLFTAYFVVPGMALACITRKLAHALLVLFVLAGAAAIFNDMFWYWIPVWVAAAVLLLGSAVVVRFQYRQRQVAAASVLFAAVVALALLGASYFPGEAQAAIQNAASPRRLPENQLAITFDPGRKCPLMFRRSIPNHASLEIPVIVSGLPNGSNVLAMGELRTLPHGPAAIVVALHDVIDERGWLRVALPLNTLPALANRPLEFTGNLELEWFERTATVSPDDMADLSAALPGACTTQGEGSISCATPQARASLLLLRRRQWIARSTDTQEVLVPFDTAPLPYSPWPVALQYYERTPAGPSISNVGVVIYKPAAFVERHVDLKDVRLTDVME